MSRYQASLAFDGDGYKWGELPTPKVNLRRSSDFESWARFTAAFSEDFAIKALSLLSEKTKSGIVYDPFVGSGTTLVAAATLNLRAVGNDLDPVSALLSRAKICRNVNWDKVQHYLISSSDSNHSRFANDAFSFFHERDLEYAGGVFAKLEQSVGKTKEGLLLKLILDRSGAVDSEIISLIAMVLAGKRVATILRGSNPVWYRRAIGSEISKSRNLREEVEKIARKIFADLKEAPPIGPGQMQVNCGDVQCSELGNRRFDYLLTSPPYVTRLDYVVNHLPELMLLSGIHDLDVAHLRESMIGTTTVSTKEGVRPEVGKQCAELLSKIQIHKSYASGRYYYPFYVTYFNRMSKAFARLKKQSNSGASGLLVIQDSYYKDVPIQMADIVCEMWRKIDVKCEKVAFHKVKTHLGQLSPKQMENVPQKKMSEWVLELKFPVTS